MSTNNTCEEGRHVQEPDLWVCRPDGGQDGKVLVHDGGQQEGVRTAQVWTYSSHIIGRRSIWGCAQCAVRRSEPTYVHVQYSMQVSLGWRQRYAKKHKITLINLFPVFQTCTTQEQWRVNFFLPNSRAGHTPSFLLRVNAAQSRQGNSVRKSARSASSS